MALRSSSSRPSFRARTGLRAAVLRGLATLVMVISLSALIVVTDPSVAVAAPIDQIASVTSGYTMGEPAALTTSGGVTIVAWTEQSQVPNRIMAMRQRGRQGFRTVRVGVGPLTSIGNVSLTEDVIGGRLLLVANGSDPFDLGPTLGTYVWVSTNQGRSWSEPTKVWDSFGTSDIALDAAGGFYAITNQVAVDVTHVQSDLGIERWPDDSVVLSDRISSRLDVDIATTGAGRRPLFAFFAGPSSFVHRDLTVGQAADVRVFGQLSGAMHIAGDARSAQVLGVHYRGYRDPGDRGLYARSITYRRAFRLGRERSLSRPGEDVVRFGLHAIPGPNGDATGRFTAVWLDADGRVRIARSSRRGWSAPLTVTSFPRGDYQQPFSLAATERWTFVPAYDADLHQVLLATRTPE